VVNDCKVKNLHMCARLVKVDGGSSRLALKKNQHGRISLVYVNYKSTAEVPRPQKTYQLNPSVTESNYCYVWHSELPRQVLMIFHKLINTLNVKTY
jgi:hypothetical protein